MVHIPWLKAPSTTEARAATFRLGVATELLRSSSPRAAVGRTTKDYHFRAATTITIGSFYYEGLHTAATIIATWSYYEHYCTYYYCCAAHLRLTLEREFARTWYLATCFLCTDIKPGVRSDYYTYLSKFRFEYKTGQLFCFERISSKKPGPLRHTRIDEDPSNRLRIPRCCCSGYKREEQQLY